MGATYWVKLYHEVLNDPKMGRLTDRLWRRVIECFLLAGEQGEGGYLPSVEDMAWTLRCDAGRLEAELAQIAEKTGIVEKRTTDVPGQVRWFVVNFEARQAAVAPAERKARQRARERKERYDGHEYVTSRDSDGTVEDTPCDAEIDTEKEKEKKREETEAEKPLAPGRRPASGRGAVIAPPPGSVPSPALEDEDVLAYHHRLSGIGLNAAQAALLRAGVEKLGAERVRKAVKDWLERGYKPWNVEGMLQVARDGWGRGSPKRAPAKTAAGGDPEYFKANMPEWVKS